MHCSEMAPGSTERMGSILMVWTRTRRNCQRAGSRELSLTIQIDGRMVTAVAPCPEDLIVSKLARLDEKDKAFIEAYHSARPLNASIIEERIRLSDFESEVAERAVGYIRDLTARSSIQEMMIRPPGF